MPNIQELEDQIAGLTMLDAAALVDRLEKRLGVSAVQQVQTQTATQAEVLPPAEQTEFSVVLVSIGPTKINVIKAVRESTTLGLKEAKDFVDTVPKAVKEGISKDEAEMLAKRLRDAGATVEIK